MRKAEERKVRERGYYVQGAHCRSCELLIEREVARLPGVQAVEVHASDGRVTVRYVGTPPTAASLNRILGENGYTFSDEPAESARAMPAHEWVLAILIAAVLILAFLALERTGITGLVRVGQGSGLVAVLLFGAVAGISSCAALAGGIVLSLARQWLAAYPAEASFMRKAEPHLLFNLGRLGAYAGFGALLGIVGSLLQVSETLSSVVVVLAALLMLVLGLQMLGVPPFARWLPALPKPITRRIAADQTMPTRGAGARIIWPVVLGALTILLPCGFTLTAESLALISGSPLRGALLMLVFALGTLPTLLAIGLASLKLLQVRSIAGVATRVAGMLVLFFALWTISARLTVMGVTLPNLARAEARVTPTAIPTTIPTAQVSQPTLAQPKAVGPQPTGAPSAQADLPPIVDGVQVVKMVATANGYEPRTFKVRVGMPVRWEITDKGTSGCTNAVIAPSFFAGRIKLTYGQTSTKEFTPQKVGTFRYSCWMGMVTGAIDVVAQ